MQCNDGWTPFVTYRGVDPTPIVAQLVERDPESNGSYPYLGIATQLLAEASAWAYADEHTFRDVMARTGLPDAAYRQITIANDAMFIDATAYLVRSRCKRLAFLAFRGTLPSNVIDFFTDASVAPIPFRSMGRVHGGFYRNVAAVWPAVWSRLSEFIDEGLEALYLTGHSLGGAMAALAAMALQYDEDHKRARRLLRGVYTFGQPMVAEPSLADQCKEDLGRIVFRHVYARDLVPRLPPSSTGAFRHFGIEYESVGGRWQMRDTILPQTFSALFGLALGGAAWAFRQLSFTRGVPFPFSLEDHSPMHYVECSKPTSESVLASVSRVIHNPKNDHDRDDAGAGNGADPPGGPPPSH